MLHNQQLTQDCQNAKDFLQRLPSVMCVIPFCSISVKAVAAAFQFKMSENSEECTGRETKWTGF